MPLFLIFLVIPIIEIALFIQLGGLIGLWPTLLCIVLTALIGSALVRRQGLGVLRQVKAQSDVGGNPLSPLAHGFMILMAGMFLITPGFFTDFLGFLLLVPAARRRLIAHLGSRITVLAAGVGGGAYPGPTGPRPHRGDPEVIDAEIVEPSEPPKPTG